MIFVSAKFFGPINLGNRTFYLKNDSGKKRLWVDLFRKFFGSTSLARCRGVTLRHARKTSQTLFSSIGPRELPVPLA